MRMRTRMAALTSMFLAIGIACGWVSHDKFVRAKMIDDAFETGLIWGGATYGPLLVEDRDGNYICRKPKL